MTPEVSFPRPARNRLRSTTARGYGSTHRSIRKQVDRWVRIGKGVCTKCDGPIHADQEWDLDHSEDRRTYLGPAHRFAADCPAGGNRSTHTARNQSRKW